MLLVLVMGKDVLYRCSSNLRYKTTYRVKAVFHIAVHIRDLALLEQIQLVFAVATIAKSAYAEFIVEKFTNVFDKGIPIFERFKLHGVKYNNYEDFKKAALLIKNKKHLSR